jgi:hypothetical protein
MTELCECCKSKFLGDVPSYDALHEIMRAQADKLQISRGAIDLLARLQPGYASKILAPRPMKRLSRETFEFVLPALGMRLVAVEDAQSLEQIALKSKERNSSQVRHSDVVVLKFTRRFFQKNGRVGGTNSRKYLDPQRVVELARKAGIAGAKARWRRKGSRKQRPAADVSCARKG